MTTKRNFQSWFKRGQYAGNTFDLNAIILLRRKINVLTTYIENRQYTIDKGGDWSFRASLDTLKSQIKTIKTRYNRLLDELEDDKTDQFLNNLSDYSSSIQQRAFEACRHQISSLIRQEIKKLEAGQIATIKELQEEIISLEQSLEQLIANNQIELASLQSIIEKQQQLLNDLQYDLLIEEDKLKQHLQSLDTAA
jgi:iron-sulfur cluster repair protein YtfE (RIC family)